MPSPKRLLDDDATPFERQLLEAVRYERPSPELSARMAAGLGLAPAAPSGAEAVSGPELASPSAAPAPGAAGGSTLAGGALTGKLAAVLLASVVALGGGALALSRTQPAAPGALDAASALAPRAPESVADERALEHAEAEPSESQSASSLREEIALVDELRAAILAGEHERARALEERYRQRFPEGALSEEVQALRRRIQPSGPPRAMPVEASSPR